jgi:hypothetical protein
MKLMTILPVNLNQRSMQKYQTPTPTKLMPYDSVSFGLNFFKLKPEQEIIQTLKKIQQETHLSKLRDTTLIFKEIQETLQTNKKIIPFAQKLVSRFQEETKNNFYNYNIYEDISGINNLIKISKDDETKTIIEKSLDAKIGESNRFNIKNLIQIFGKHNDYDKIENITKRNDVIAEMMGLIKIDGKPRLGAESIISAVDFLELNSGFEAKSKTKEALNLVLNKKKQNQTESFIEDNIDFKKVFRGYTDRKLPALKQIMPHMKEIKDIPEFLCAYSTEKRTVFQNYLKETAERNIFDIDILTSKLGYKRTRADYLQ